MSEQRSARMAASVGDVAEEIYHVTITIPHLLPFLQIFVATSCMVLPKQKGRQEVVWLRAVIDTHIWLTKDKGGQNIQAQLPYEWHRNFPLSRC